MNKGIQGILLSFILILFLSACEQSSFYDHTITLGEDPWAYDESLDFSIGVSDTSAIYDMHLNMSYSEEYAYENVYLRITTEFPTRDSREENLNVQLADKGGNWIGKCSSGVCTTKVYLLENFRFPENGEYVFSFEQYTRDSLLNNIKALQLSLYEKTID